MVRRALLNMSLGFILIMVDVRVRGFDLVPDIVGYILFALAINDLERRSECYAKAKPFNFVLIALSIFTLVETGNTPSFIGPLGYLVGIAALLLNLLVVYYLLMGTKEVLVMSGQRKLATEADRLWLYYLILKAAGVLSYLVAPIPILSGIYIVALLVLNIVLAATYFKFLNASAEAL